MSHFERRGPRAERQRSRTTVTASQAEFSFVKCGYLWKTSFHPGRTSSKSRYFVLTKSSLDHFRNHHREKVRGSLPLASIDSIKVLLEDSKSFKITGPFKHPLILQASGKDECHEWIKAIDEGIQQWRLDSDVSTPVLQKKDELDNLQDCFKKVPKMRMLYPSLSGYHESAADVVLFSAANELHHEYPMIKYARGGRSIPHERVFKLDNDNLHLMWKKRGRVHGFTFSNTLCLDRVVEVRCGQQTKNFVKFPYAEVESQSFSLIFEKQQGEWSQLCSLDLICDSPKAFEKWKSAMREIVYSRDLRVNRHKYNGVDPITLWLKRNWSVMSSRQNKGMSVDQALSFAHGCCPGAKRKLLRNLVKEVIETQCGIVQHDENLLWNSFLMLFNVLNKQPRLYEIFYKYAKDYPDLGMTPAEFAEFLFREQEESLSLPACTRLMSIHDKFHVMYKRKCAGDNPESYRQSKTFLSFHGFLSYLRSKDNSAVNPEHSTVYQDMDHPLTDYFINSSHNTYLSGHQLKGKSSLEAYVRALLHGCRCVELDCWDGPEEPVITHGLTLTSKIRFRDVVQVIREYAFESSEFPLILSLENHCSEQQQVIMANTFVTELGHLLATTNLCEERGVNTLPSPKDLKGKILLKGKIKVKKKHKISTVLWPGGNVSPLSQLSPKLKKTSRALLYSQSEAGLIRQGSSQSLSKLQSLTVTDDKFDQSVINSLAPEEQYNVVPLEDAMGKLIVYCRAAHYKKNEISDDCCEMYSFNDGVAQDYISAQPRDILSLANKHVVRSYPKGSRVDSSNYNPQTMWNAGIQMAAVNFQKPDCAMHLNQGKFRKNGGCGYILKPESLRNRVKSHYHPLLKESPRGGKSCYFTLEILSGQYLHVDEDSQLPIRVEVETVGAAADCASLSTEPTTVKLNPQFEGAKNLFKIIMPELCLVYFKVHVLNRNKSRLLFQNVICLDSLRSGIHYIPLQSPTGVEIPHSGLFVRMKFQEFEPASDKIKGTSRERLLTF